MATKQLNNIEAGNLAMEQALESDPTVVLYGEDTGYEGGVFRATQGLQQKFGQDRVWDAPIAEAAIVGIAIGAAIGGLKPIAEIQFQGFSYPIFQQLFTHAVRLRNRTRGRISVPMVIRMPMGGGIKALEHHSEAIEALYAHVPGIKVVMPATPYDVKGMLTAAINDPDPVIFLEHKKIYRAFKEEVPLERYEVPLGKANVVQEGETLTLVTYGAQLFDCLKAIEVIKQTIPDASIELIDLRTIRPLDTETIVNSVAKTGRLVIVHEAVKSFSVSAEIIARVNEKAFLNLMAPPARVTGYDITVPLAKGENFHLITVEKIVEKIDEVLHFEA